MQAYDLESKKWWVRPWFVIQANLPSIILVTLTALLLFLELLLLKRGKDVECFIVR